MKVLATLLSILLLLVGLPLLHGFLAFLSIEDLSAIPNAMSFYYLFAIPAWVMAIIIFVMETYRRSFIRSQSGISNTLLLGLAGMLAPGAGMAISPVAAEIGLVSFAGIAVLGLFVGLLGAVLFNFTTNWIRKIKSG